MGAKHTTERERELFQQLISTGMSVRKISRLTGRSHDTVSNYVNSDVVQHTLPTATTEEEMYKVFDLHHAGKRTIDIAIEMNRPPSTIRMIVKRLYQKHENAYQRWIEMQKQKETSALVMEVQTVEAQRQDEPEHPGIDWQAKWCEAQIQIADLRETNDILKGYVRLLHSMSDR